MQILGLADSTPKPTSRIKDLFWPNLTTEPNAQSACESASWACFFIAGITALVALFTAKLALIDATVFLFIGLGLRRFWRTAAIAGFILYLMEQGAALAQGRFPGIVAIFVTVILLNSVRASFAYHSLRNSARLADQFPAEGVFSPKQ